MNIEDFLDKMKSIQAKLLEFIEDDENVEENFQNLILIIEDNKIRNNMHNLRLFLHHVTNVCANHHRGQNFFSKIERVLQIFKDDLKKYCTNSEILDIFKRNKRILLFLIEEQMLIFDKYFAKTIFSNKYIPQREINKILKEMLILKKMYKWNIFE